MHIQSVFAICIILVPGTRRVTTAAAATSSLDDPPGTTTTGGGVREDREDDPSSSFSSVARGSTAYQLAPSDTLDKGRGQCP